MLTRGLMDGSLVSGTLLNTIGSVPGMDVLQGAPDGDILSPLLFALLANEDSLNGLSADERALLLSATGSDLSSDWGTRIAEIKAAAIADYGVTATSFSASFMNALDAEIDQFIADRLDADDLALRADFTDALEVAAANNLIPGVSGFDQEAWNEGPWVVLLPRDLGVVNFSELDGASAVLRVGGAMEQAFAAAFTAFRITYEPVPVETLQEAAQQFLAGTGDLLILPQSAVQADLLPSNLMLVGQDGAEVFAFGEGGLTLMGGNGDEALDGASGAGNDDLKAGIGEDSVDGGAGDDTLKGGSGADRLLDFEDDMDALQISTTLTGGITNAATVISTFGAGNVLDFGNGNTITPVGVSDLSVLENDISFI